MRLMFDEITNKGIYCYSDQQAEVIEGVMFAHNAPTIIVVQADNVSEYLQSDFDVKGAYYGNHTSIANCIPPFISMFIECKPFAYAREAGCERLGFYCARVTNKTPHRFTMYLFHKSSNGIYGPQFYWSYSLLEDGSVDFLNGLKMNYFPGSNIYFTDKNGNQRYFSSDEDDAEYLAITGLVHVIPLMTISLMNCHNVELIDNPPKPLTRAERRRGDPERVSYKTIKVLPIRKVYNTAESDEESESGLMPLHICRGHFKDFRNGPGLFGKYKEIFWWEQHVRGSAENGRVIKDYEVEAPEAE